MTIKSTVSFTNRHHDFAAKKVNEGIFASVSSLVAAGIEQIMQNDIERKIALKALEDTIRRRMETPRNKWIEMDTNDNLFGKVKAHLKSDQS